MPQKTSNFLEMQPISFLVWYKTVRKEKNKSNFELIYLNFMEHPFLRTRESGSLLQMIHTQTSFWAATFPQKMQGKVIQVGSRPHLNEEESIPHWNSGRTQMQEIIEVEERYDQVWSIHENWVQVTSFNWVQVTSFTSKPGFIFFDNLSCMWQLFCSLPY